MRPAVRLVSLSLMSSIFFRCATDNAAAVRQDRPFSIGILGAGYRPHADIGMGLHGSVSQDSPAPADSSKFDERKMKERGQSIGFSFVTFPWKTSAFCFGLGVNTGKGKVSFDADVVGSSTEKTRVEFNRSMTYVGVPVGWYWIWENGFTFFLNFGPNYRVAHKTSLTKDGGLTVDAAQRDDFISSIEDAKRVAWGYYGLMGYSF